LNLTTLAERRVRGDLIHQFKIVNKYDLVNWHNHPRYITNDGNKPYTRGHKYRIVKENTKYSMRQNFFINRVANHWNALPENVVEVKLVNTFKTKIDEIYNKNKTYKTLKR
jgi:hypothetical protein